MYSPEEQPADIETAVPVVPETGQLEIRSAGRLADIIGHVAAYKAFDDKDRLQRAMRVRAIEKWEEPVSSAHIAQAARRRRKHFLHRRLG